MAETLVAPTSIFNPFLGLPVGLLCTLDRAGKFVEASQGWIARLGLSPSDLIGRRLCDLVHDADRNAAEDAIETALRNGEVSGIRLRLKKADGAFSLVDWSASYDAGHDKIFALATGPESKSNRSEQELKEQNAALERRVAERTAELLAANEELEAFCFSISHDLRAPLRAIDGFSKAVLQDNEDILSSASKNHLMRVRNATKRMSELIDSLLSLTRLTRLEIERQWVDMSDLAVQSASDLESASPSSWVRFEIQPGLQGYGDPRLLRLLIENLLSNAFKFSSRVEDALVRFGFDDGWFFVSDNGAGFDMAYVSRLFQPFERLHPSADYPGTGIGLATAQRIVSRHGGVITAEGRVGTGATFRFTLSEGLETETEETSEA